MSPTERTEAIYREMRRIDAETVQTGTASEEGERVNGTVAPGTSPPPPGGPRH